MLRAWVKFESVPHNKVYTAFKGTVSVIQSYLKQSIFVIIITKNKHLSYIRIFR
jgi:hypothetical protein